MNKGWRKGQSASFAFQWAKSREVFTLSFHIWPKVVCREFPASSWSIISAVHPCRIYTGTFAAGCVDDCLILLLLAVIFAANVAAKQTNRTCSPHDVWRNELIPWTGGRPSACKHRRLKSAQLRKSICCCHFDLHNSANHKQEKSRRESEQRRRCFSRKEYGNSMYIYIYSICKKNNNL